MDFIDKITEIAKNIGDKTTEIAKNIGDKTNEVVESTRLNSKINTEKEEIKKNIYLIGEYYHEKMMGGTVPDEVKEYFDAIATSQETITQYEKEIEDQKFEGSIFATSEKEDPAAEEMITCPRCGAKNDPSNKFCYNCGASLTPPAQVPTQGDVADQAAKAVQDEMPQKDETTDQDPNA